LKLKVLGMNAAFGYNCRIQVGQDMVIATAACTAVYLESLPPPQPLQITTRMKGDSKGWTDQQQNLRLSTLQKQIEELTLYFRAELDKAANVGAIRGAKGAMHSEPPKKKPTSIEYGASATTEAALSSLSFRQGSISLLSEKLETVEEKDELMRSRSPSVSSSSSSSSSSTSSSSEDSNDDASTLESPQSSSSSEESDEEADEGTDPGSKEADEGKKKDKAAGRMRAAKGKSPTRTRSREDANDDGEDAAGEEDAAAAGGDSAPTARQGPRNPQLLHRAAAHSQRLVQKPPRRLRRTVFKDDRPPFILELDDETDADIAAVLSDWIAPVGFDMVNISFVPGRGSLLTTGEVDFLEKSAVVMCRGKLLTQQAAGGSSTVTMLNSTAARTAAKAVKHTLGRSMAHEADSVQQLMSIGEPGLTAMLNRLFQKAYLRLCFSVQQMVPCQVLGISHHINILEEGVVEVFVSATVQSSRGKAASAKQPPPEPREVSAWTGSSAKQSEDSSRERAASLVDSPRDGHSRSQSFEVAAGTSAAKSVGDGDWGSGAERRSRSRTEAADCDAADSSQDPPAAEGDGAVFSSAASSSHSEGSFSSPAPRLSPSSQGHMHARRSHSSGKGHLHTRPAPSAAESAVRLSSLQSIPGASIVKYLGPLQLHFIKDSWNVRGEGAQAAFFYNFISEANAVARSHVAALGGNALLMHRVVPQESGGRLSRNQVYNMFSVTGDAVLLHFPADPPLQEEANGGVGDADQLCSIPVSSWSKSSADFNCDFAKL